MPKVHIVLAAVLWCFVSSVFAQSSLIDSSVKLRIDTNNSHSWGTGTIIDARSGEALILTCGHIFRDSQGKGNLEVHLFKDQSTVTVSGRCLFYDLEIDLALVTVHPPCPVRTVPLAPPDYPFQANQQVYSVGCDGGGNPSVRNHQIMSRDRVGTPVENKVPFHYIQVSGAPVSGRSGGGLFSSEGYLLGVCNTADPVENDGHFVPPQIIRYVLNQVLPEQIYQNLPSANKILVAGQHAEPKLQEPPAQSKRSRLAPLQTAPPVLPITAAAEPKVAEAFNPNAPGTQPHFSKKEQATLEHIRHLQQDGYEVVLIAKSRRNPNEQMDVIYLNDTSEKFVATIADNNTETDSYNPVIFSSNERKSPLQQETQTAGQRPVSFSVNH